MHHGGAHGNPGVIDDGANTESEPKKNACRMTPAGVPVDCLRDQQL
tara:strand:- start:2215 stop:2352 length:138 start_codon:yes stop_codon:yes gene_type:complete